MKFWGKTEEKRWKQGQKKGTKATGGFQVENKTKKYPKVKKTYLYLLRENFKWNNLPLEAKDGEIGEFWGTK